MYFVLLPEQADAIALYRINLLGFLTATARYELNISILTF